MDAPARPLRPGRGARRVHGRVDHAEVLHGGERRLLIEGVGAVEGVHERRRHLCDCGEVYVQVVREGISFYIKC